VRGGTGATAIAEEAQIDIDVRSNSAQELGRTTASVLAIVEASARDENARWNSNELAVEIQDLGARPAGNQAQSISIACATAAAVQSLGVERIQYGHSSTDCNIPISRGIPAIAIPGGGMRGATTRSANGTTLRSGISVRRMRSSPSCCWSVSLA
jgi:di/tripeptidase